MTFKPKLLILATAAFLVAACSGRQDPVASSTVPAPTSEPAITTSEPILPTSEPAPQTSEPAPETSEPAPQTSEPAPYSSNEQSSEPGGSSEPIATSEPAPETSEPAPQTSEPAPQTSEPAPQTSEPAPQTSEPAPSSSDVTAKLTIRLNPCGGEVSKTELIVAIGSTVKVKSLPTPSRDGYAFEGWCTAGDPGTKMGKPGTEVTEDFTAEKPITLYARWTKASAGSHTEAEIKAYEDGLKATSQANHLYFHYYRFDNKASSYADWDVWAWPYRPTSGEGTRFDWNGRTTSQDKLTASGDAILDDFGGAVVDIDLTKTYDGGTSNKGKAIGGKTVSFYQKNSDELDTQIGVQIVKSSSRTKPEGKFWTNDSGDLHVDLTDPERVLAIELDGGGVAWHTFALQDHAADFQGTVINSLEDPYADDDGNNVTVLNGKATSAYNNVDWNSQANKVKTANFANKDGGKVGAGYQIQVATYADSDGDGFGDIYGIQQKLPYLKKLGVRALWLTPVQLSDSYHGYDISDYEKVDPKFGSKASPNGRAAGNIVTEESAMADYLDLIQAAKNEGMVIVMDLVLNHTSTSNRWFIKSAQLDPEYRGFYQWGNHLKDPNNINENKAWYPYGDHPYSYYAKFGSSMPELNYQYKPTRDAVIAMTKKWVELGVGGFRLDAVKHIFMKDEAAVRGGDVTLANTSLEGVDYSTNLTKNVHFWRELNKELKAVNPNVFLVGENFDGNAYAIAPFYEALDSCFDFWAYYNFTGAGSRALGEAGDEDWVSIFNKGDPFNASGNSFYNGKGTKYWNLGSMLNTYDEFRGDKALNSFFTSNHDIFRSINRLAGQSNDNPSVKINANNYDRYRKASDLVKAAQILMPGITWIYYGDEIGMTGNIEIEGYDDLSWRQPMKWVSNGSVGDGSMTTGFSVTGSGGSILWDSVNKTATVRSAQDQFNDSGSEFNKLAEIIAFKNAHPQMVTGSVSNDGSSTQVLKFKNGSIAIEVNFNTNTVKTWGGSYQLNVQF